MQKTRTCFWFDRDAESAAALYISLIPNSSIKRVTRYTDTVAAEARMESGGVLTVELTLGGIDYLFLNGGPIFPQSEAASIMVSCDSQEEVDRLWSTLTADGGSESMCGWLKDKFGVSWQIVPRIMDEIDQKANPDGYDRAMAAMMEMRKLDGDALERAYRG